MFPTAMGSVLNRMAEQPDKRPLPRTRRSLRRPRRR
jgi:hypothetical protein